MLDSGESVVAPVVKAEQRPDADVAETRPHGAVHRCQAPLIVSLGAAQMSHILDLRLNDVGKLLEDRAISLELTEPARQLILAAGSDAAYGARPLKRALQRMVQDPLAIKILNGEVLHGAHVRIDVDRKSNQLHFEPMTREAMA